MSKSTTLPSGYALPSWADGLSYDHDYDGTVSGEFYTEGTSTSTCHVDTYDSARLTVRHVQYVYGHDAGPVAISVASWAEPEFGHAQHSVELTPDVARELALALLKAADELEAIRRAA